VCEWSFSFREIEKKRKEKRKIFMHFQTEITISFILGRKKLELNSNVHFHFYIRIKNAYSFQKFEKNIYTVFFFSNAFFWLDSSGPSRYKVVIHGWVSRIPIYMQTH
jgi:hypothetical protein